MRTWSSVPIADTCLDSRNRGWVLVRPALVPFESLWHCRELGVSVVVGLAKCPTEAQIRAAYETQVSQP